MPMTTATATVAACCSSTGECRDRRNFQQIERSGLQAPRAFFSGDKNGFLSAICFLSLRRKRHDNFTLMSRFRCR
ncbi:hypothetical protein TIFTF001_015052 [Ficus carica]|uniref:Uncharacterized protein n=1 Tax=Ficus carica TaxID=3494 RepID=A0AA88A4Y6_FICCA|nr:hypothetical protein TIFTF001_015052 [Ficus carica]